LNYNFCPSVTELEDIAAAGLLQSKTNLAPSVEALIPRWSQLRETLNPRKNLKMSQALLSLSEKSCSQEFNHRGQLKKIDMTIFYFIKTNWHIMV
jgi:hypothetical protein